MESTFHTSRGYPYPYGVSKTYDGYNFSIFSKHAKDISLCLFDPQTLQLICEIPFHHKLNRTGNVWHIEVHKIPKDFQYGFRLDGPYEPLQGKYFDQRSILLDPFAKLVASPKAWGKSGKREGKHIQKACVDPFEPFDWEDIARPNIPLKDLVIYEMHVRGFTIDPSSGVKQPGTFLGIIEKIPHLKSLGVNAVELLPIFEFNESELPRKNAETGEPLYQYWGYSTVNFFSPMNRYAIGNSITEFKTLVKELHANGIEVILDVVYNHTAEGNQDGPILSFKGIENSVYYMLGPNGEYYNFSGCGNTFNCNHPIVRHFILESLRYWTVEMHIDGFRFDLASVLVRSHDGIPLSRPPLIEAISVDPILANTKLIAEAWDAGGLYQVGSFPFGPHWSEWNGKYRDEVRRFLKGTDGEIGNFATRITGSEDLYGRGRSPLNSINFIIAHDGFSLYDLVSYNQKHNLSNGEENRDGTNQNDSWNCGVEGVTNDPLIIQLRQQQMRNHHLALMISQGVPMIHMGDEYAHTKNGNNNTWSQDSPINWFLWNKLDENQGFFRFYRLMIDFRKAHPVLSRSKFLRGNDVTWHGLEVEKPDWSRQSRFLALSLPDPTNGYVLYIAFNASFEEKKVSLPRPLQNSVWKKIVDTSKAAPEDFLENSNAKEVKEEQIVMPAYSALLLKSSSPNGSPNL